MVVKFQRPIFGGNKVLIYDSKETIRQEIPMTPEIRALFGEGYKMYRKCTLSKKGFLSIGKEVKGHF